MRRPSRRNSRRNSRGTLISLTSKGRPSRPREIQTVGFGALSELTSLRRILRRSCRAISPRSTIAKYFTEARGGIAGSCRARPAERLSEGRFDQG